MKTLIRLFVVISICMAAGFALSSCKSQQIANQVVSYVQEHCPKTYVKNPLTGDLEIHYECDTLWPTQKINEKCTEASFCIDIANGKISGTVACPDLLAIPPSTLRVAKSKR